MVACTMVGLWVEDDDLGFTSVSRTSSVLGGSRTRSVLGGSGLGEDNRAWVDRASLGWIRLVWWCRWVRSCRCWDAISLVFQGAQSRQCWMQRDRASSAISLLFLSLSLLFSLGGIHLKVKYKQKWFYRVRGHILRSTKMIFRLTQFSLRTQTPSFTEKHFWK